MSSEACPVRRYAEIYRIGLVDGNTTRLLQKVAATPIAKVETHTVAKHGTSNMRQLLLSLNLLALLLKTGA